MRPKPCLRITGHCCLRQPEAGLEVKRQRFIELVLVKILNRGPGTAAGIVDDDVEPARLTYDVADQCVQPGAVDQERSAVRDRDLTYYLNAFIKRVIGGSRCLGCP